LRRPNGTANKTLPDVYVYKKPIDQNWESVSPRRNGPPVLVIEVVSKSTFQADLNCRRGKGWSYEHAGVREYVVLDPGGAFIPTRILAWRLADGKYVPCAWQGGEPWWSSEIPIGIAIEGDMIGVYDREHRRQLREGEILETLAQKDAEIADKEAQIADRDAEIAALCRRLAQFGDR
jgi:hypothetical protein